jgi:hypothetical protein
MFTRLKCDKFYVSDLYQIREVGYDDDEEKSFLAFTTNDKIIRDKVSSFCQNWQYLVQLVVDSNEEIWFYEGKPYMSKFIGAFRANWSNDAGKEGLQAILESALEAAVDIKKLTQHSQEPEGGWGTDFEAAITTGPRSQRAFIIFMGELKRPVQAAHRPGRCLSLTNQKPTRSSSSMSSSRDFSMKLEVPDVFMFQRKQGRDLSFCVIGWVKSSGDITPHDSMQILRQQYSAIASTNTLLLHVLVSPKEICLCELKVVGNTVYVSNSKYPLKMLEGDNVKFNYDTFTSFFSRLVYFLYGLLE